MLVKELRDVLLKRMLVLLAFVSCSLSGPSTRPVSASPPPPSQMDQLGYDEAVTLGASYAQSFGYQYQLAEARWTGQDWRLRYYDPQELRELELHVNVLTHQVAASSRTPDSGSRPPGATARDGILK